MMVAAHDASSAAAVGRQMKTLRRLGVSDTPVTLNGPPTANSRRCGSVVMPNPEPICESASECSIGGIKSSGTASKRCTNAAASRCVPALT